MEFLKTILPFVSELVALVIALIPMFRKISQVANGQKCQLRSEMLRIYYHNRDKMTIRQYEFENFTKLYAAYKALNGNSFIDKVNDEIMKWKVIS